MIAVRLLQEAAGPDHQNESYEDQLTQPICDHLGLPRWIATP